MTSKTYADRSDAYSAAGKMAQELGHAFMIRWPSGEWTVEPNKPSLRTPEMEVIEHRGDRQFLA